MWRRIGVILLWVLATVGTASITLAAVGQVGESTTEQAAVPVNAAELRSSPAVQRLAATTTTTTVVSPTTALDSTTTTTALGGSTTTTEGAATTTTTTMAQQGETVVRSLVGGTVTVFHQGSSVTLVSAVPVSGGVWTVEIKNGGPQQVVVEFESASHESHYQATVESGELVIEIDESPEGGDD